MFVWLIEWRIIENKYVNKIIIITIAMWSSPQPISLLLSFTPSLSPTLSSTISLVFFTPLYLKTHTHYSHNSYSDIHGMGRNVTINWIPSHVGTAGNDKVDTLAPWPKKLPNNQWWAFKPKNQATVKRQSDGRKGGQTTATNTCCPRWWQLQSPQGKSSAWWGRWTPDTPRTVETVWGGEVQDSAGLSLQLAGGDRHSWWQATVALVCSLWRTRSNSLSMWLWRSVCAEGPISC